MEDMLPDLDDQEMLGACIRTSMVLLPIEFSLQGFLTS